MAHMLETPSRVWRRIEAQAAMGKEMPSLPSMPGFDDSGDGSAEHVSSGLGDSLDLDGSLDLSEASAPGFHSTPSTARLSSAFGVPTPTANAARRPDSASSTARFAQSVASRSNASGTGRMSASRASYGNLSKSALSHQRSFNDVSIIQHTADGIHGMEISLEPSLDLPSMHDSFKPPPLVPDLGTEEGSDQGSVMDALESLSRASTPPLDGLRSPEPMPPNTKGGYDYSVSLRSAAKPSPMDKYKNISLRKPLARTRTPSLSRTTPSPESSDGNITPRSNTSFTAAFANIHRASPATVPLPRSATASPAIQRSSSAPVVPGSPSLQSLVPPGQSDADSSNASLIRSPHVGTQSNALHSEHDVEEPTFSSEEPTPMRPTFGSTALGRTDIPMSSPAPSVTFTPTPAYQPRPRARFAAPALATHDETDSLPDKSTTADDEITTTTDQENVTARPVLPAASLATDHETPVKFGEEPFTPFAKKRSFLMGVINSTARPRFGHNTPRPTTIPETDEDEDVDVGATPMPAQPTTTVPATPAHPSTAVHATPAIAITDAVAATPATTNMRTMFVGATPLPRARAKPRLSHPLAQAWTTDRTRTPSAGSSNLTRSSLAPPTVSAHTPAGSPNYGSSPGGGLDERASFISTASSHDLTTHARANASFDPLLVGSSAAGTGVGRFNAGKLNAYLHGLNRRLQQENEGLVVELERVRSKLAEQEQAGDVTVSAAGSANSRRNRRASSGGSGGRREGVSGSVLEDVDERSEALLAFEAQVEELRAEIAQAAEERDEAHRLFQETLVERERLRAAFDEREAALDAEQQARAEERKNYKSQMGQLEDGVQGIVQDLERRANEAEAKLRTAETEHNRVQRDFERIVADLEGERDQATERAERAEMALESDKDLGSELKEANERAANAMGELRTAAAQIKELEAEVVRAETRAHDAETEAQTARSTVRALEADVRTKWDEVTDARKQRDRLQQTLSATQEQLAQANACIAELEEDAGAALGRIQILEQRLDDVSAQHQQAQLDAQNAEDRVKGAEAEAERATRFMNQMEGALQAAETRLAADDAKISDLKAQISKLERGSRDRSTVSRAESAVNEEIEALETELDDAHRQIARLTTQLSQSPARKALENAKNAKIEMLENEREELLERIRTLKMAANASMSFQTPGKVRNTSGISPVHRHVLNMTLHAPKTPGGPLRDLSWLHNTTRADPSVAPLVAEIRRLQAELDQANQSVDDKLDRLEESGNGVIGLAKKLEDARATITALEEESARLKMKDERRTRRLQQTKCGKCRTKIDMRRVDADQSSIDMSMLLPSEPPTPAKTTDALRADLRTVNAELDRMRVSWAAEKRQLQGEKASLQALAQEAEANAVRAESAQRGKSSVEAELQRAKLAITEFEAQLTDERARLRALVTEKGKAEREKHSVAAQLQRTEADINDVKQQLSKFKQENSQLEKELRASSTAEQKARLLESRVAENLGTIDQLRQERSLLASNHRDLQKQFAEVSNTVSKLRSKQAATQSSHDGRRQELDAQREEMEDLRRQVSSQADELEKARIDRERNDNVITRTVAALEADLARVRKEAEIFGRDLQKLRRERDRAEGELRTAKVEAQEGERRAKDELELVSQKLVRYKEDGKKLRQEIQDHVCAGNDGQVVALKAQHKKECKGLVVQIRYLKAKFGRETLFRCDLGYQKQYLLVLLAQFERSEQRILAAIAQVGFPSLPPARPKQRKSLRVVAHIVIFVLRTRRASEEWREQCRDRVAIAAALHDVRTQRSKTVT